MSGMNPSLLDLRLDPNDETTAFIQTDARSPKKKIALAIGLLVFGIAVLASGLGVYLSGKDGGKCAVHQVFIITQDLTTRADVLVCL